MIISRKKREENIAEYILYMWQIEDLMRAFEFNRERIQKELVEQFAVDPAIKKEISEWYADIVDSMIREKITKSGHLQFLVSLVADLNDFHFRLIDSSFHSDYQNAYQEAIYNIGDFRNRMGLKEKIPDIEVCLTVLYGSLLMKMRKRDISDDTAEAISSIRKMIALFSSKYRDFEEGRIEI
ncbi:MAG: DUF4924 family protein [Bacteroidales bacterium]|jgi:hypothetical protein|nr:DUF4924 family protein [Bacteroidales bacterium]MDD2570888.1 DUF4924 family protein [Bacteroidales bacterium]MDD2812944.1 DUF4924 family protein [Bacteroidales bacterium]MDD3385284.1 DUF4924 family protein [Bacteroidales bacterium]MDD3811053.1 DUF4924 family protein [Bacteroidales bacterium]